MSSWSGNDEADRVLQFLSWLTRNYETFKFSPLFVSSWMMIPERAFIQNVLIDSMFPVSRLIVKGDHLRRIRGTR